MKTTGLGFRKDLNWESNFTSAAHVNEGSDGDITGGETEGLEVGDFE